MMLKGLCIAVDLVEIDAVGIRLVLDHIKEKAVRFVLNRILCVVEHGLDERLSIFGLDVNRHDQGIHI
jgi:hypothetical protein